MSKKVEILVIPGNNKIANYLQRFVCITSSFVWLLYSWEEWLHYGRKVKVKPYISVFVLWQNNNSKVPRSTEIYSMWKAEAAESTFYENLIFGCCCCLRYLFLIKTKLHLGLRQGLPKSFRVLRCHLLFLQIWKTFGTARVCKKIGLLFANFLTCQLIPVFAYLLQKIKILEFWMQRKNINFRLLKRRSQICGFFFSHLRQTLVNISKPLSQIFRFKSFTHDVTWLNIQGSQKSSKLIKFVSHKRDGVMQPN